MKQKQDLFIGHHSEKKHYIAPAVTTVEFRVEVGTGGSDPTYQGTVFYLEQRNQLGTTGESSYHWNTYSSDAGEEGWF